MPSWGEDEVQEWVRGGAGGLGSALGCLLAQRALHFWSCDPWKSPGFEVGQTRDRA